MAARLQKIVETLKGKNDGLMIEVGSLYNLIINKLNLFVKILLILFQKMKRKEYFRPVNVNYIKVDKICSDLNISKEEYKPYLVDINIYIYFF